MLQYTANNDACLVRAAPDQKRAVHATTWRWTRAFQRVQLIACRNGADLLLILPSIAR